MINKTENIKDANNTQSRLIDPVTLEDPQSRSEMYLHFINSTGRVAFDQLPKPQSRIEWLLYYLCEQINAGNIGGGAVPNEYIKRVEYDAANETLTLFNQNDGPTVLDLKPYTKDGDFVNVGGQGNADKPVKLNANGLLATNMIPEIAINRVIPTSDKQSAIGLIGDTSTQLQSGDVVVLEDENNEAYMHNGTTPTGVDTFNTGFIQLSLGDGTVKQVNGQSPTANGNVTVNANQINLASKPNVTIENEFKDYAHLYNDNIIHGKTVLNNGYVKGDKVTYLNNEGAINVSNSDSCFTSKNLLINANTHISKVTLIVDSRFNEGDIVSDVNVSAVSVANNRVLSYVVENATARVHKNVESRLTGDKAITIEVNHHWDENVYLLVGARGMMWGSRTGASDDGSEAWGTTKPAVNTTPSWSTAGTYVGKVIAYGSDIPLSTVVKDITYAGSTMTVTKVDGTTNQFQIAAGGGTGNLNSINNQQGQGGNVTISMDKQADYVAFKVESQEIDRLEYMTDQQADEIIFLFTL